MTKSLLYHLCDTAFPCGSFCFSNGIESLKHIGNSKDLKSYVIDLLVQAGTELPFVIMAYENSDNTERFTYLSRAFSVLNINDKRLESSEKQGTSYLLSIAKSYFKDSNHSVNKLKNGYTKYFPIVFGACCCYLGLSKEETIYIFMLTYLKNCVTAAVRLDLIDAYESQLFMIEQDALILDILEKYSCLDYCADSVESILEGEGLEQKSPVIDIYQGLHSTLITKLFFN